MIPRVTITRVDGQTGVVRPGEEGILCIIAPSEKGPLNQPSSYTRPDLALADFGYGPLTEIAAYVMSVAQNPVLLIRSAASQSWVGTGPVVNNPGTATVAMGSVPLDDFAVQVTFVTGGTIGTAGITYTTSLDGGRTQSAINALGTAAKVTIPNSGITFNLGAGTILDGETVSMGLIATRTTNSDIVPALEALRVTASPWDAVLVHCDADANTVALLDLWLTARESEGRYHTAILNTRLRNVAGLESEAQYRNNLQTQFASSSSIRVLVGADGGDVLSPLRGIAMRRPASIGLAARGMAIDIGTDAAFVADGPLSGWQITDDRGNPKYHDEALFPGLDDMRFTTFRSFFGLAGVYITNPLLFSPAGSDYVYWQHARTLNKACEITFQLLTNRLSQGIQKDAKTGFILEHVAQEIEGLVQAELDQQLVTPRRVSGAQFVLSRTDDLSSNAGATLTGEVRISALAYVKKFAITAQFVRRITATAT